MMANLFRIWWIVKHASALGGGEDSQSQVLDKSEGRAAGTVVEKWKGSCDPQFR